MCEQEQTSDTDNYNCEDYQDIIDFVTFRELPECAHLYFFCVLDFLVSLAYRASFLFTQDPAIWPKLTDDEAEKLGKFYTQYGTEPDLLDLNQRRQIFSAIFKAPNNFSLLRDNLLTTCARYAENLRTNDNKDLLSAEVETALIPFRDYLLGLQGGSLRWSRKQILRVTTEEAYPILRFKTVAAVFGVPNAPNSEWPSISDPNGNLLVEEMTNWKITRGCFSVAQQVALTGAETIRNIVVCEGQVNDKLIKICNSWNSALRSLSSTNCRIYCK